MYATVAFITFIGVNDIGTISYVSSVFTSLSYS